MSKLRTLTTMIYTDGKESVYGVFVGPMRGSKSFNLHTAEQVASYRLIGQKPDYRAMSARHATADAPAVPWQA